MRCQVHHESTCDSYEIAQGSLSTTTQTQRLIALYLKLSQFLNYPAEGNLPSIEFDELNSLNDLACCLYSLVFESIDFMKESSILLGNTAGQRNADHHYHDTEYSRPAKPNYEENSSSDGEDGERECTKKNGQSCLDHS